MSHKATNWAWGQRGLTPAQKLVLMCLADCHNPANGCFPTQQFIADECEISRRSVNTHLEFLEQQGLITRLSSIDPDTYQQRPTRYHLAFEDGFRVGTDLVDKSATRVQDLQTEPCAKSANSRVQNLHTNPVSIDNRKNTRRKKFSTPLPVGYSPAWAGDASIRERVANDHRYGEGFARSYIDTARPDGVGGIVAAGRTAFDKLSRCAALSGIRVKPP